jgi:hypothetical protein
MTSDAILGFILVAVLLACFKATSGKNTSVQQDKVSKKNRKRLRRRQRRSLS